MRRIGRALLLGLLVWVIPFVVAIFAFPLRESDRPFFESIMPVSLVIAVVISSALYFRKVERQFLREGVFLGVIFLTVSLVIDLLMFSRGPMAMSFSDYVKDIGFTYLLIPAITIGLGWALARRR